MPLASKDKSKESVSYFYGPKLPKARFLGNKDFEKSNIYKWDSTYTSIFIRNTYFQATAYTS